MDQEGIIEGSAFQRYTLRLGLTHKMNDDLTIGANMNSALAQHDRLPANAAYFGQPPGIVYSAMVHSPVAPYNDDGTINQRNNQGFLGGGTSSASNPLAIMKYISEDIQNTRVFGNMFTDYNLNENITFKSLLGYNVETMQQVFIEAQSFFIELRFSTAICSNWFG